MKKVITQIIGVVVALFLFTNFNSKPISNSITLFVFSGSDWCSNCIRFEKKILSNKDFLNELAKHKVGIKVIDFPQRKKLSPEVIAYNNSIAEKLEFNGSYPTLIIYSDSLNRSKQLVYQNEEPEVLSVKVIDKVKAFYE